MNKEKNQSSWFPGHMKKARFLIGENLKNVDLVFEVLDARAPRTTQNMTISNITKNKLRLVILGKNDLAEEKVTKLWIRYFKENGVFSISADLKSYKQVKGIIDVSRNLLKELYIKRNKKNIENKRFRAMVVGVPNVGKSTLINSMVGKKKAKTGNFPGVTKSEQWVNVCEDIDLLDTPGNLSFEDKESCSAFILELLGSIKGGAFDEEEVAFNLLKFLKENKGDVIKIILNIDLKEGDENELIRKYGMLRNMLKKGGEIDLKRASETLIKEFREGKFGRITLEMP